MMKYWLENWVCQPWGPVLQGKELAVRWLTWSTYVCQLFQCWCSIQKPLVKGDHQPWWPSQWILPSCPLAWAGVWTNTLQFLWASFQEKCRHREVPLCSVLSWTGRRNAAGARACVPQLRHGPIPWAKQVQPVVPVTDCQGQHHKSGWSWQAPLEVTLNNLLCSSRAAYSQ